MALGRVGGLVDEGQPLWSVDALEPGPTRVPAVATVLHLLTLVGAVAVWLYLDRHLWFYGDEWDFLVDRGLFHARWNVWVPHNEHWSTLPILLWRAIFSTVQLRHYWAYELPTLLVHVAVLHLLWRRCLREGVNVWVAVAVVALVAFLGSSGADLSWAFQIGFLASLAFGLLALDLLDSPDPTIRTDAGVVIAAVAALMCSDVGIAMLVALAVTAWAQRGWRRAVTIVSLPAVSFVVWFLLTGYQGEAGTPITVATFTRMPRFVWHDARIDVGRLFDVGYPHERLLPPLLLIMLFAWLIIRSRWLISHHATLVGLVCGDVVFHIMVALSRERLGELFSPGRYVYVDAVFLLPAFALMLGWDPSHLKEATAQHLAAVARWAKGAAVLRVGLVIVLLLGAADANVRQGDQFIRSRDWYIGFLKKEIIGSGQLLAEGQKAIDPNPINAAENYLPPAAILSLEKRHLLPKLVLTPAERTTDETILAVAMSSSPVVPGRFELLKLAGVTRLPAAPNCVSVSATSQARHPRILFRLAGGERSAAVWVEGKVGQRFTGFLSPNRYRVPGSSGTPLIFHTRSAWISDDFPREHLIVHLPRGRFTFCELVPDRRLRSV